MALAALLNSYMFLNWVYGGSLFRAVQSILRTYFGKMLFRYVNIGAITLQLRTYMRKSLLRYVNFLLIMHFRSV